MEHCRASTAGTVAASRPPPRNDLDLAAWRCFCALVARGAGKRDDVHLPPAEHGEVTAADRAYLEGLVAHHHRNVLPALVERCGIRGRSLLDVGAGTGALAVAAVQAGARAVTAVEPIGLNCEAGIWRARAHRLDDRIRFHHLPDTARLPFPDGTFDVCVCSSVLQYVPDRDERARLLREMHRVARRGGILVVCGSGNGLLPGGPHAQTWWSNLLPREAARRGHRRGVSYWEVRAILSPLGVVRVRPASARDSELVRWRERLLARDRLGSRAAAELLSGAGRLCEATLCRLLDAPVEAFMPYPFLAFRKAP